MEKPLQVDTMYNSIGECTTWFDLHYYSILSSVNCADHTAGDFLTGIAGRLRVKVIRIAVYDYRFSNNITHSKPIRFYSQVCVSTAPDQRR